ncbi:MAG: dephospho-CoA kinase [Alphaproteobacteria bacterium]|nr:dephospho-CoA kinase [Alphaproteobacteria bacterium]
MKIIGITGSIGCGKTYLANILKNMGYSVYNPDHWVRNLYKKKDFLLVIKKYFPTTFDAEGIFNKRELRNIVFNDNKQLKILESIIHPFLKRKLKKIINKYAQNNDFLFLDAALLLENKWDKYCDYIIVADVEKEIQIQRVMKRDNIKKEDVKKIIAIQTDNLIKYSAADYIINTALPDGINKVQIIKFLQEIM